MDEQERIERRAHVRLIITEVLMFLSVILLVGFLTLIVMGYSFNLKELGGSGEVVERSGLVQISSAPAGATIFIDGDAPLLLATNASRTMLAGEHEISLSRDGFSGWSKKIVVTEGMMYRLNYPRLFKEEREKEEVMRFYASAEVSDRIDKISEDEKVKTYAGKIKFVSVSPNNEQMMILLDKELYLVNINDNTPVLKILAVPSEDGSSVAEITTIESAEWSGNSERLLAKMNGEWVVINVRNAKETVWLTKLLSENGVNDIKFENEAGDRLLVLNAKKELAELNVREEELSDVLLENVERFDNDGDKVVYLAKTEFIDEWRLDGQEGTVMVEGYGVFGYRVGDEESHRIVRTEGDKDKIRIAIMQYFQDIYVGVYDGGYGGGRFSMLIRNGWVSGDGAMAQIIGEKVDFDVTSMKKRGKGMVFELVGAEKKAKVFDIEAMAMTEIDTTGCGWVDEFLRYRIDDGKLSVLDYDGLNERTLVDSNVANGHEVVISGNGRWMYYFGREETNNSGEIRETLIREKIN
ncbi:PEGA domain-containing protein [Candidatus Saccharibacteria bacterium]|nr:PEGA domain-containing protein [Candidatus Saccharibacteria bacterium]